jgi:hypothetical protein
MKNLIIVMTQNQQAMEARVLKTIKGPNLMK